MARHSTKLEFQPLDVGALVLTIMMSFIMVGIGSFDLFGVDFAETATTLAGFDLTTAYVLTVVATVAVLPTNDNLDVRDLHDEVQNLDRYYARETTTQGTVATPDL